MPKKRFSPEQIVTLLRQIEVTMARVKRRNFLAGRRGFRNGATIAGARSTAGLIWTRPGG